MNMCTFLSCNSTNSFTGTDGGGAIFSNSASLLSVTSSVFVSCLADSMGGGVFATENCQQSHLSLCRFFLCDADYGGGTSTHNGPISEILSSHFISCESSEAGGGFYHNGLPDQYVKTSNCLFAHNIAHSSSRGGGGFEDGRSSKHTIQFLFSFFTANRAPTGIGNDITIHKNAVTSSPFTHCFRTSASNSFWNNGSYADYWLPLTNCKVIPFPSLATANKRYTYEHIKYDGTYYG